MPRPGECDDVDVVTPAGAGDAAFEDGDALFGDGGLGRVTEERDRVTEDPVDGYLPRWRNDRVSGGYVPNRDALPMSDRHGDAYPQAWIVGLFADLFHADRVEVEHHPVIDIDRSDVADHAARCSAVTSALTELASVSFVARRIP